MKINLFKSWGLILLFSLIISGCTLDEYMYDVVVEKEVKNVKFSFCLVNEKGQAANVFKEGEHFAFEFKIKNKTTEALPFYDYGFYNTYDFMMVKSGSAYVGKPMKFLKYCPVAEVREIAPDATETFTVPWQEERSEFQQMYGYFEGLKQPNLAKGKYYTKFTYKFRFSYPDQAPKIETGKMTFIINFEIK